MRKSLIYLFVFFLTGCEVLNGPVNDVSPIDLDQLRQQILTMANSENCTNASEWTFTPMGNKPCGGPERYIAYSRKINEDQFLKLVNRYTALQAAYNQQTGAASDCALVPRPSGVICENNKPIFTY